MTPPREAPDDDTARTEDPGADEQEQTELRQRLVRRLREGDVTDVDVDVGAEHDQRDYDVVEHALRAMLAEHGGGQVVLVALTSVARRHRRDHDPELDAAAAERLEREVVGDELDDEAPAR
jgi:hypothetical protein